MPPGDLSFQNWQLLLEVRKHLVELLLTWWTIAHMGDLHTSWLLEHTSASKLNHEHFGTLNRLIFHQGSFIYLVVTYLLLICYHVRFLAGVLADVFYEARYILAGLDAEADECAQDQLLVHGRVDVLREDLSGGLDFKNIGETWLVWVDDDSLLNLHFCCLSLVFRSRRTRLART